MQHLRPLFNFYLDSSIHVGVEVCCFVLITYYRFEIPTDWGFLGFVFFGTITGYNFIKYAGVAKWHHRSLTPHLKHIQVFSFFCFVAFVFFVWQLSLKTLLAAAFFGLFTLFYAVPVFPGKKTLRTLNGIKIFIIAFVVTGLTMIIPLFHFHSHQIPLLSFEMMGTILQRFLFIIVVLIPFEIRDLEVDDAELGTIPQKIGVKNAKLLGFGLLVVFLVVEFLKRGTTGPELISVALISLVSAGFILFSKKDQSEYYASFWVEAIPIMWFLIFWSASLVFA